MRVHYKIKGLDRAQRNLIRRADIGDEVDKAAENAMKRIQFASFRRAPVLTGFLSSNLVADENRKRKPGTDKGAWILLEGTDYTWIQEHENARKPYFLRNSADEEVPRFRRDLLNILEKGKSILSGDS